MEIYSERPRTQTRAIDPDFKLTAVHYRVINFASQQADGRTFLERDLRLDVQKDKDDEAATLAWKWQRTILRNMEAAGYLTWLGQGRYEINPLAINMQKEKKLAQSASITLKPNHIQLLTYIRDGSTTTDTLRKAMIKETSSSIEQDRQARIFKGMITKLRKVGYIESIKRGEYVLTEKAMAELSSERKTPKQSRSASNQEVKITAFDRHLLEVISDTSLSKQLLETHPKRVALSKRIEILTNAGLIEDGNLSAGLIERITLYKSGEVLGGRILTVDRLTSKQKDLLKDIRQFQSISEPQILKYIYNDDRTLMILDLEMLVAREVISKDKGYNAYFLNAQGIRISSELLPYLDQSYRPKIHGRREEVRHDLLLYSAFKALQLKFEAEGKVIDKIENDRQLRSRDAKANGFMSGSYPDLRIYYTDKNGLQRIHDLELDISYSEGTISKKVKGTNNDLTWVASSYKQALRASKGFTKADPSLGKARSITLYVLDDYGNLRSVRWP